MVLRLTKIDEDAQRWQELWRRDLRFDNRSRVLPPSRIALTRMLRLGIYVDNLPSPAPIKLYIGSVLIFKQESQLRTSLAVNKRLDARFVVFPLKKLIITLRNHPRA